MKFLKSISDYTGNETEDDPIAGVAQLFDISIAFIVAIIAAMFTLLASQDILNKDSEWTLVKKGKNGDLEMVEKKNNQVIKRKISNKSMSGNGVRLGTAYQLENGQIIYVTDTTSTK